MQFRRLINVPVLVALAILFGGPVAFASEGEAFKAPSISILRPDWDAVRAEAAELTGAVDADALAKLNEETAKAFPANATSPAPVLIPLDTRAYLTGLAAEPAKPAAEYLTGFQASGFFLSGPAGYDAVFSVKSGAVPELSGIGGSEPVLVEISASTTFRPRTRQPICRCAGWRKPFRISAASFSKIICVTPSRNTA